MGFDVISYVLSKKYVDDTVIGMGSLKGSNCSITSIVDNSDGTHDITFSWKDTSDVTHTSVLTVSDGETPTFSSAVITGGHRITFTTEDRTVSFDVMDGSQGTAGISVVSSNVDDNNNLTFTLSNGNVISAGKINAVTIVDTALSTSSSNPVENKVITNALNNKVDKESGKGLSTEDFTTAEKDKLSNIEDNAQVNVIEKLIINGAEATVTDKAVALTLITSAVSNLQNYYLKSETYTKTEIEDLIGSTVGVTIEIVEELPTEGQSNIIYFLPTETTDVYSQYIYTADGWILIGSTTVDLSNYYTKTQVDTLLTAKQDKLTIDSFPTSLSNNPVASGGVYTAIAQMQSQFQYSNMPTASADNLGYVYQYIGATGTYTQNMFYRCIYDDTLGEYQWKEVIFNATVTVDSAISSTSENPVQNKVIKAALDEKQDTIQYSTMPSAQDNLGKIVQYNGTTTSTYTNGYFYKAVYDSDSDVYSWKQIEFSEDILIDSALSDSSENPVQNKVITNAITEITDVIPSDASSSNQLVDRDSLGTASQKDATSYVRPNNYNLVESNAVYNAIANAISSIYTPHGNITVAELLPALLISTNVGNVYTVTDSGTTTEYFIQGAGETINSGDTVSIIEAGEDTSQILFNLMGNMIDLSYYQTKELSETIEGETTVEDALSALSTNKVSVDLVPSDASASNKLVTESENYPKLWVSTYLGTETIYKFTFSAASQTHFLINIAYGGSVLVGIHTRISRVEAIQLGTQSGSSTSATKPTIKVSSDGLMLFVRCGSDTPITISQLYPNKYTNPTQGTISMTTVSSSDADYTSASEVTVRNALTDSDLTSSVTSGSTAPITSGGVYNAIPKRKEYSYTGATTAGTEIVLDASTSHDWWNLMGRVLSISLVCCDNTDGYDTNATVFTKTSNHSLFLRPERTTTNSYYRVLVCYTGEEI